MRKLLRKHGYVRRKAQKSKTHKSHPDRDQQFRHIAKLQKRFKRKGLPVISIDTKKNCDTRSHAASELARRRFSFC